MYASYEFGLPFAPDLEFVLSSEISEETAPTTIPINNSRISIEMQMATMISGARD
jgi:hypothetical protein